MTNSPTPPTPATPVKYNAQDARGVEFERGESRIYFDTSGGLGRVLLRDSRGRVAQIVMPEVVLEGLLRGALDAMARAAYEARAKHMSRGAA